jgi:ER lumen protein retaining receptor
MRCFGFGLLNFKMWGSRSAKSVSLKTLELYAVTFAVRILSIIRHQGYLPYDKTGDWFYHVVRILFRSSAANNNAVSSTKSFLEEESSAS